MTRRRDGAPGGWWWALDSWELLRVTSVSANVLVFAYAAARWTRSRDTIDRQITYMFAPAVVLGGVLVLQAFGVLRFGDGAELAAAAVLLQPLLTLRLAARVRYVPPRVIRSAGAAYLLVAPLALTPYPWPRDVTLAYAAVFIGTQVAAARYFTKEARARTGTSAARLTAAAIAAWSWVALLLTAAASTALGATRQGGNTYSIPLNDLGVFFTALREILLLVSAAGYVVAFVPPGWLGRLWSASALRRVGERLLDAPPHEPAAAVWRRYAEVVAEVSSADAVCVLAPRGDGSVAVLAAVGPAPDPPPTSPEALRALLALRQPVALPGPDLPLPRHYAAGTDARWLTAAALPDRHGSGGVLLTLHRHRSLFGGDDLRLLGVLAASAGALAARSEVLAAQRRLTAEREQALADREAALAAQQALAGELSRTVTALTSANQAKSDFLAAMSHELRTPLNAIIGFSDLMRAADPQPAELTVPAEWVTHIHDSGRRLLHLINDLLDLSKVEAGRLDLELVPTRLDVLIEGLVTSLHPLFADKALRTAVDVPRATVLVDVVRFRQVMENLLSNAVKFTPPGGAVTVRAEVDGAAVTLLVADTGAGIAAADTARVFDAFTQVGPGRQRDAGTGLGLALCQRIARAHGGDLTVTSRLGVGSTFRLRLPDAVLAAGPYGVGAAAAAARRGDAPDIR